MTQGIKLKTGEYQKNRIKVTIIGKFDELKLLVQCKAGNVVIVGSNYTNLPSSFGLIDFLCIIELTGIKIIEQ